MSESELPAAPWSADDATSIGVVLATLDDQAATVGAARMAGVWRDWADLLRPTAEMMRISTLRVPAPFARALLDDLRNPPEELDDDPPDAEQLECDAEIAAAVRQWIRELDGEGERTLIVHGSAGDWLKESIGDLGHDALPRLLYDGSTDERDRVVAALAGWTRVMAQLDEQEAVDTVA